MTLAEAARLFHQLWARAGAMATRIEPEALNAAIESVVESSPELVAQLPAALGADGGSAAEALRTMMGSMFGQAPMEAPTAAERVEFATSTRVIARDLGRVDELLEPMEWHEGRGPVIADLDLSIGEMLEALAAALEDGAIAFGHPRSMLRARLPGVDDAACGQAFAYVHGWLAQTVSEESGDDDMDREPRDLACAYAREHLDEFCWSVTDEYSPFGNDAGADMFAFAAAERLAPTEIWHEVMGHMAEEWDFDGTLPETGVPGRVDVDIARHLVGAAFASIVLWGEIAEPLAAIGCVAARLIGRTVQDPTDRDGFAAQCERMAASIAAAPVSK